MASAYTLVASAARTTTGNSGSLSLGYGTTVNLEVEVTAVSGTTPSMALAVLWSDDGVNFGAPDGGGDTFAAITATGNVVKQLQAKGPFMQIVWTITGTTPSFTFSVLAS